MSLTALFSTIHESHYTILANFYLYLQYFQQKNFNFNKINGSQIDPSCVHFYVHEVALFYKYIFTYKKTPITYIFLL